MNLLVKYLLATIIFTVFFISNTTAQKNKNPKIDQYWLVILKTGPQDSVIKDSAQRRKLFAGHFANMTRLYNAGILKAAGPFGKNEFTWRGLFVLDCKTKEDAENYLKTDPSIAAEIFVTDLLPWYSEAVGSFKHGKPGKKP